MKKKSRFAYCNYLYLPNSASWYRGGIHFLWHAFVIRLYKSDIISISMSRINCMLSWSFVFKYMADIFIFFRLVSTLINSIYFGKIYSSKKQYSTDGNDQKCCYLLVRLFFKDFYFILDCKFATACRFVVSLIRITHSLTYFHIFVTTFVHRFFWQNKSINTSSGYKCPKVETQINLQLY